MKKEEKKTTKKKKTKVNELQQQSLVGLPDSSSTFDAK